VGELFCRTRYYYSYRCFSFYVNIYRDTQIEEDEKDVKKNISSFNVVNRLEKPILTNSELVVLYNYMKQVEENIGELIEVLGGLVQVMRSCCRDEAFCEGVTLHQFMILDAVAKEKELHIADLHKILSVEKSTTTRLVNPLINKGLLRRDKADYDSRAAKLILTGKGNETYRKVQICLVNFFQRVLGNIPANRRTEILESVQSFITAIRKSANGCNCC